MPTPGTWATEHFTRVELSCKHCNKMEFPEHFLRDLEDLRIHWDTPLVLNSAYRCAKHPEEAKKAAPGEHNRGAVDIHISGPSRYFLIKLAMELGWSGIGIGLGFLHLDRGESRLGATRPSFWSYT
jgi:uncharacterized protein YcbK (DUF882 family)